MLWNSALRTTLILSDSIDTGSKQRDAEEQTQVQINQQRIVNRNIARIRIISASAQRTIHQLDLLARAQDADDALRVKLDTELGFATALADRQKRRAALSREASRKSEVQKRSMMRAAARAKIVAAYQARNEEMEKFANEPAEKKKAREAVREQQAKAAAIALEQQRRADIKALQRTKTGKIQAQIRATARAQSPFKSKSNKVQVTGQTASQTAKSKVFGSKRSRRRSRASASAPTAQAAESGRGSRSTRKRLSRRRK